MTNVQWINKQQRNREMDPKMIENVLVASEGWSAGGVSGIQNPTPCRTIVIDSTKISLAAGARKPFLHTLVYRERKFINSMALTTQVTQMFRPVSSNAHKINRFHHRLYLKLLRFAFSRLRFMSSHSVLVSL
jgi:hypothetical protein